MVITLLLWQKLAVLKGQPLFFYSKILLLGAHPADNGLYLQLLAGGAENLRRSLGPGSHALSGICYRLPQTIMVTMTIDDWDVRFRAVAVHLRAPASLGWPLATPKAKVPAG
jgi:hypothetical protein